jgi:hypothetical protein
LGQRKFDEVRRNEKEVRALEEYEQSERFRMLAMTYESHLKIMQERHKNELDVLTKAHQRREEEFLAVVETAVDNSGKRMKVLKGMIAEVSNPETVWNRYHRFEARSRGETPVKLRTPFVDPKVAGTLKLPPVVDIRRAHEELNMRAHAPIRMSV